MPMRPRTQTARTNHLGYDVGASRKIPEGALARIITAECLQANKSNVLTRFALMLFRLLCFGSRVVKAALKATAAIITTRPADRGGSPSAFQLQVKVEGATLMQHFKVRRLAMAGPEDGVAADGDDGLSEEGHQEQRRRQLEPDRRERRGLGRRAEGRAGGRDAGLECYC